MQAIDPLICKANCDHVTDRRRKNRYTQPINKNIGGFQYVCCQCEQK